MAKESEENDMPKINHEEYKILKGLDDQWKWIARDSDGEHGRNLFAYLEKPFKSYDMGEWDYGEGIHPINIHRFQFIQWGDEIPYNIADLIEDYEIENGMRYDIGKTKVVDIDTSKLAINNDFFYVKESEETEVKRDKEDLVKYLEKEISNFKPGEMIHDYLTFILKQLNQLDEPEVLSQDLIDKYSYNIEEYWEIADMMVEPQYAVSVENLPNLLVPKQELPVIPQFVADWYEEKDDMERAIYWECIAHQKRVSSYELPETDKFSEWFADTDNNPIETLINMKYGYEVEEEQKYYVDLETAAYVAKWVGDGSVQIYTDSISGNDEYELHLTEQEIKDYDERFWPFRKPVEEVEE